MSVLVCSVNPEILIGEVKSGTWDLPWRLCLLVLLEEFSFHVEGITALRACFHPKHHCIAKEKVHDLYDQQKGLNCWVAESHLNFPCHWRKTN